MNYQFKGNLRGYLCTDCDEFLTGVIIRLYKTEPQDRLVERAVADVKETFHQLTEEEVKAKGKSLIGEATVDERGNFTVSFPENYDGTAFDIDFECGSVPPHLPRRKKYPPVFFHITTLQPQWREMDGNFNEAATHAQTVLTYSWSYAIPKRWWCLIRSKFHEYVVCGRVIDCETKVPIRGLKVSGFDYDLIQDDPIGFAITDADGKYKLYYSEADFSKTIFSWLNVEWPAGPDLYFRIETATGDVLLQEDRNRGRQQDRSNSPHCVCIDFCVKFRPDVNYVPALFTHVGNYSIVTGFDGSGYTNDSEKNAFTQSIPLIGILPGGVASNAMEYRFKVKNLDTAVEVIVDAAYMNAFQIGTLNTLHFSPFSYTTEPYYVNNPGGTHNVVMAADGWIAVPRENSLFGSGQFNAGTVLGSLNTEMLTKEFFDMTTPSIYKAGDAFPAGQKAGIHTFRITFEAREVGTSTIAYSTVLQKIVISNVTYSQIVHPSWAGGLRTKIGVGMLEIAETTATGAGCNKVEDVLTANYSVVHPHLENVTISFEGNAPLPGNFSAPFSGTGESVSAHAFTGLNSLPMKPCAYIIHLVGNIRLTSGYGRLPWAYVEDHIAFCKS
jgi:hypothetical protein